MLFQVCLAQLPYGLDHSLRISSSSFRRALAFGFALALSSRRWQRLAGVPGRHRRLLNGFSTDSLVEGWSERPACAWGNLLESRVLLLGVVRLTVAGLSERTARVVLVERAGS